VREFSEVSDDILTERSTSTDKALPPKLISGGLPPIPAKLVKRIQDGLFVEMVELLAETLISLEYTVDNQSASSKQKPKEVTNITDWVQCFGLFIAIISLKEPHRIPDLIGYQNLTMRSSFQCQEGCWAIYDRRFRLKASAVLISEWSAIDITVWKTAFPERPPTGVSYVLTAPQPSRTSQLLLTGSSASPSRICLEWNENTSPECLRPPADSTTFVTGVSTPMPLTRSIKPSSAHISRNDLARHPIVGKKYHISMAIDKTE